MKIGDSAKTPQIAYLGTKAAIEAYLSPLEGMEAISTDTHEKGFYNGSAWQWAIGGGDMLKSVYDPTGIEAPPFIHVGLSAPTEIYEGRMWLETGVAGMSFDFSNPNNSAYLIFI